MRSRVVRAALGAAGLAIAVLVIPLAIVAVVLVVGQARQQLEHDALAAALVVGPGFATGDPVEVLRSKSSTVGVYDLRGHRVSGSGPSQWDRTTSSAAAGSLETGGSSAEMITAEPVSSSERVIAVVRVSRAWGVVAGEAAGVCVAILGVAATVLAITWLVARRTGAALSLPIERLGADAAALGNERWFRSEPPSGIFEVDVARRELTRSAARLQDALRRERRSAADASHQLRTPLTGMRARLESALNRPQSDLPRAVTEALATIDRLDTTIDEVLALTRGQVDHEPATPVVMVVELSFERWTAAFASEGRPLRLRVEDDGVLGPRALITNVLDVLLDNALAHGSGTVTVVVRDAFGRTAIDVSDDGRFTLDGDPFADRRSSGSGGLGLGIAARAATDYGARLVLAATSPKTRFTLLLPDQNPLPRSS